MTVITTIKGFGDLFWVDVVAQIDTMNDTVVAFQAQAKKLPKANPPPLPVLTDHANNPERIQKATCAKGWEQYA